MGGSSPGALRALFNAGAYAAFKPAQSVNLGGAAMGAGVYRIPHLAIESLCVYTHSIPCGHARSPGEPQMVFAGESHMGSVPHNGRLLRRPPPRALGDIAARVRRHSADVRRARAPTDAALAELLDALQARTLALGQAVERLANLLNGERVN